MRHKWNRELRQLSDGRHYFIMICAACRNVREKAWNGYIYYEAGYDPVNNNTGAIGTFRHSPGNCKPQPQAATDTAKG